mmetsp:Transcript_5446/g.12795  ORF Transcript_5446/g.12795 Transcript_5446/m.12795 type:complete len:201 (-) Transcript_5446:164-766(-)
MSEFMTALGSRKIREGHKSPHTTCTADTYVNSISPPASPLINSTHVPCTHRKRTTHHRYIRASLYLSVFVVVLHLLLPLLECLVVFAPLFPHRSGDLSLDLDDPRDELELRRRKLDFDWAVVAIRTEGHVGLAHEHVAVVLGLLIKRLLGADGLEGTDQAVVSAALAIHVAGLPASRDIVIVGSREMDQSYRICSREIRC